MVQGKTYSRCTLSREKLCENLVLLCRLNHIETPLAWKKITHEVRYVSKLIALMSYGK